MRLSALCERGHSPRVLFVSTKTAGYIVQYFTTSFRRPKKQGAQMRKTTRPDTAAATDSKVRHFIQTPSTVQCSADEILCREVLHSNAVGGTIHPILQSSDQGGRNSIWSAVHVNSQLCI